VLLRVDDSVAGTDVVDVIGATTVVVSGASDVVPVVVDGVVVVC